MRWGKRLVSSVAALAAITAASGTPAASETQHQAVRVESGWLRGSETPDYHLFQGIPYAAAPVGELRWRSPQPPVPWTGTRDATKPGARCAQLTPPQGNQEPSAEDCLFLNVTAPRHPGKYKPVVVWVHGGGFLNEAGSDYDARRMAVSGDVVVVTVNYRLGIFGLFTYPGLTGSGGFALEDQQAALRWVRRNISRFGGDPGNVTLAGESAGGKSACGHLASPSAAGLFHRVILMSAPCTGTVPAGAMFPGLDPFRQWMPTAQRQSDGVKVAKDLGCTDIVCLRGLTKEELLVKHNEFMSPTYGNAVLPQDPDAAIAAGRVHKVPVISGITKDEMTYAAMIFYDLNDNKRITREQYDVLLHTAFGDDSTRVAQQYPVDHYVSPSQAWVAVTTDVLFACPTAQRNKDLGAWSYEFAEPSPPMPGLSFPPGAPHASDLPYLFPEYGKPYNSLSDRMIRYWTTFARTGKPAGHDVWPRYPATISLTSTPGSPARVDLAATHNCGLWATIPQVRR
ncbi:carboxylesterase family protein [Kibdelosporangium philippinense]|uniref:Carboxylic ester hydrolase n=1 Tax=Kibdelosporangium philippinense TaxID=211113 RepID=A0ABS8ZUZ6_9PSEU|nr:carboxylesterase family protein [Kibdelosporangium philippinense]MCE7011526.1 carboxylesterase family protein [Kibdelosporangium philippinense]